jgi:hypothetical protein
VAILSRRRSPRQHARGLGPRGAVLLLPPLLQPSHTASSAGHFPAQLPAVDLLGEREEFPCRQPLSQSTSGDMTPFCFTWDFIHFHSSVVPRSSVSLVHTPFTVCRVDSVPLWCFLMLPSGVFSAQGHACPLGQETRVLSRPVCLQLPRPLSQVHLGQLSGHFSTSTQPVYLQVTFETSFKRGVRMETLLAQVALF